MKISAISSNINRLYPSKTKNRHFSLVQDTVSFCAKKNPKNEISSMIEQEKDSPSHMPLPITLNTNKHNLEFSKMMVQDDSFPHFLIPDILKSTNKSNIDSRIEAYKFLKSKKGRLKNDYVYALSSLRHTEPSNVETLKMMASRKNFPKSRLSR